MNLIIVTLGLELRCFISVSECELSDLSDNNLNEVNLVEKVHRRILGADLRTTQWPHP